MDYPKEVEISSDEAQGESLCKRPKLSSDNEEKIGDSDSEVTSGISGIRIHPLSIDHILLKILTHFAKDQSASSLLSLRHVNAQWSSAASEVYSKVHPQPVIIFNCSSTGNNWKSGFIDTFRHQDSDATWSILKHFRFIFKSFYSRNNPQLWPTFLQDFSQCVGDLRLEIKDLSTLGCQLEQDEEQWEKIAFPRLKRLEIHGLKTKSPGILSAANSITSDSDDSSDVDEEVELKRLGCRLLTSIFSSAVLLTSLECNVGFQAKEVLESLMSINGRNLTHLKIMSSSQSVEFLCDPTLPLPKLSSLTLLENKDDHSIMTRLGEILQNHSQLEELVIKNDFTSTTSMSFVPMEGVKRLEISGKTTMDWTFLKYFPKLKQLIFPISGGMGRSIAIPALPPEVKFPTVSSLHILESEKVLESRHSTWWLEGSLPPGLISHFSSIFPSLRDLHVNLHRNGDLQILSSVFVLLPRLTKFTIELVNCESFSCFNESIKLDPILTGIEGSTCTAFVYLMVRSDGYPKRTPKVLQLVEQYLTLPNITCLTDLQHFKILSKSKHVIFTDLSARALLQMEGLRSITMESYHMTPSAIRELEEHTKLNLLEPFYDKSVKQTQLQNYENYLD